MTVEAAYCGIDIGLKRHFVGLLDESQNLIRQYDIPNDLDGFMKIENDLEKKTKICLEPTGVYSINLFIYFQERGYDIRFVETKSSRHFRIARFGKKKNDRLDCLALAKYRAANDDLTFDGSIILNNVSYDSSNLFVSNLNESLLLYTIKSVSVRATHLDVVIIF